MSPTPKKKSSDETKKKPAKAAAASTKPKAPAAAKKAPAAKKDVAVKQDVRVEKPSAADKKEDKNAMKTKGIRIRLSGFDYTVIDEASMKIIDTAVRTGAAVRGPTPLPTKIRKFTVNRSTFVHKDARDQFEMRIHRRLIDLSETTFKTVDALQNLSLPSGVDIEIRM